MLCPPGAKAETTYESESPSINSAPLVFHTIRQGLLRQVVRGHFLNPSMPVSPAPIVPHHLLCMQQFKHSNLLKFAPSLPARAMAFHFTTQLPVLDTELAAWVPSSNPDMTLNDVVLGALRHLEPTAAAASTAFRRELVQHGGSPSRPPRQPEICKRSGSSWRQQPGKQSKPATPLLAFSPGTGKRRQPGSAAPCGLGMARSSRQQPGATRDMPSRACLPRKRGQQGALGEQRHSENRGTRSSRSLAGGNTSSRISQHMRQHLFV